MIYKCPKCEQEGPFDYRGNLSLVADERHDYCICLKCKSELIFVFKLIEIREEGI